MSLRQRISVALGAFLLAGSAVLPLAAQQGRWEKLNKQVMTLYGQGKYTEAIPVAQEALRVAEATFGIEHPNVATSLNNLAVVYQAQGKYAEAELVHRRALAIREKVLGPEHPDVALSLNNLAEVYQAQGKYAEAEPLFRRSLAIREKALGPEHPDVAASLNNLAAVHQRQGKYAEAEPLFRRALAIMEKVLGPEHPDVATAVIDGNPGSNEMVSGLSTLEACATMGVPRKHTGTRNPPSGAVASCMQLTPMRTSSTVICSGGNRCARAGRAPLWLLLYPFSTRARVSRSPVHHRSVPCIAKFVVLGQLLQADAHRRGYREGDTVIVYYDSDTNNFNGRFS